jgi:hypothetical protein
MRAWLFVLVAGCSSGKVEQAPQALAQHLDAGAAPDGITEIGHYDPAGGAHLDEDGPIAARPHANKTPGKPVDIMLRSSPPGAMAAIDGQQIGRTPTYAAVPSGAEHNFTFVLDGYALARYRFVPIQSGVVHATMEAVSDNVDAGVALPPEMLMQPPAPPPPDAAVDAAPAPPPLPPADAAAAPAAGERGPFPPPF